MGLLGDFVSDNPSLKISLATIASPHLGKTVHDCGSSPASLNFGEATPCVDVVGCTACSDCGHDDAGLRCIV